MDPLAEMNKVGGMGEAPVEQGGPNDCNETGAGSKSPDHAQQGPQTLQGNVREQEYAQEREYAQENNAQYHEKQGSEETVIVDMKDTKANNGNKVDVLGINVSVRMEEPTGSQGQEVPSSEYQVRQIHHEEEKEASLPNEEISDGVQNRKGTKKIHCSICGTQLVNCRPYYKRYRTCRECASKEQVMIQGKPHRFCQQCGKFEPVELFDGLTKTCRDRLSKHAERRRQALRARKIELLAEQSRDASMPTKSMHLPEVRSHGTDYNNGPNNAKIARNIPWFENSAKAAMQPYQHTPKPLPMRFSQAPNNAQNYDSWKVYSGILSRLGIPPQSMPYPELGRFAGHAPLSGSTSMGDYSSIPPWQAATIQRPSMPENSMLSRNENPLLPEHITNYGPPMPSIAHSPAWYGGPTRMPDMLGQDLIWKELLAQEKQIMSSSGTSSGAPAITNNNKDFLVDPVNNIELRRNEELGNIHPRPLESEHHDTRVAEVNPGHYYSTDAIAQQLADVLQQSSSDTLTPELENLIQMLLKNKQKK